MKVNIHEAKTHFSRLLQRVGGGEEVTIARAGVPVAKLVPVEAPKTKLRPMGMDRGKISGRDRNAARIQTASRGGGERTGRDAAGSCWHPSAEASWIELRGSIRAAWTAYRRTA